MKSAAQFAQSCTCKAAFGTKVLDLLQNLNKLSEQQFSQGAKIVNALEIFVLQKKQTKFYTLFYFKKT